MQGQAQGRLGAEAAETVGAEPWLRGSPGEPASLGVVEETRDEVLVEVAMQGQPLAFAGEEGGDDLRLVGSRGGGAAGGTHRALGAQGGIHAHHRFPAPGE